MCDLGVYKERREIFQLFGPLHQEALEGHLLLVPCLLSETWIVLNIVVGCSMIRGCTMEVTVSTGCSALHFCLRLVFSSILNAPRL